MPRKPRTLKMKKLAAGVAKGLSITEAGRLAGYSKRQAASRAYKTIRLRFHPALEAAGYDVDKELTTAYAKLKEKMECTETIFFHFRGVVIDERVVIPHDIQRKAANVCLRFLIGSGRDDSEPPPLGERPGHISLTLVLPLGVDPKTLLELQSVRPVGVQQPVMDVESHKDQRRPGSQPTL
jgi:hypothetical protein